jgi:F-type H+-transporting ATPase subunit a
MGHHLSWYNFIPGYQNLLDFLQKKYYNTVVFDNGLFPKIKIIHTCDHMISAIVVSLLLIVITLISNKEIKKYNHNVIPSKSINILNIIEIITELLITVIKNILGKKYKIHTPLICSLFLFILCSNILGLIPGFTSCTDNLNTNLALGLTVFIYFNYHGFKVHGINHILHLANPLGYWWGWLLSPLMFPLELLGMCIRPFSLAIRLTGNMMGDHLVFLTFAGIMPILIPLPIMLLGLLICIIQSTIFCILTCVYIELHTQESH